MILLILSCRASIVQDMFHRLIEASLAAEMKIGDRKGKKEIIHQEAGTKRNRKEMDNKFNVRPATYLKADGHCS